MKTISFKTLAATIFASVAFVACVQDDEFEVPSSVGTEENQNLNTLLSQIDAGEVQLITIGELKAQFQSDDEATAITSDIAVKGYVSSSDATGNFYKEFFIQNAPQDATDAVKISLNQVDSYNQFNIGREVYISLKNLYLGEANGGDGVFTIGGAVNGDGEVEPLTANEVPLYVFRSATTETIVPKDVTSLSSDDIGIFVTLNDTEFPTNEVGQPYVASTDDYDTQRTVQRCSGFEYATFLLETSSFASFKNEVLPSGGGSISGIVSKTYNGSDLVLALNTTEDVQMNDSRCELLDINDFVIVFQDTFDGNNLNNWSRINVTGSQQWGIANYGNPAPCARISGYSGGSNVNEDWLISNAIDLSGISYAIFNFQSIVRFTGPTLKVYISTDYSGGDPNSNGNWTELSVILDTNTNDWNSWTDSGVIDLNSYVGGDVFIAFKYTSSNSASAVYQIDNFSVLAQ